MSVLIRQLVEVKIGRREPDVRLRVDPYSQGIPISDHHPLPDVKLAVHHDLCVLNILLNYPLGLFLSAHIEDFDQVLVEGNASAA